VSVNPPKDWIEFPFNSVWFQITGRFVLWRNIDPEDLANAFEAHVWKQSLERGTARVYKRLC